MTKVLKMIFENTRTGKSVTWTLTDPKDSNTQSSVAGVMMAVIGAEVIKIDGDSESSIISIKDAYIYTTEKVELA